jgi:hypothetical protein
MEVRPSTWRRIYQISGLSVICDLSVDQLADQQVQCLEAQVPAIAASGAGDGAERQKRAPVPESGAGSGQLTFCGGRSTISHQTSNRDK